MFDVIVIGGSYSGMSAALQLARARRSVVVIDAGVRRNRFADTSHGVLGQDGRNPSEIVSIAKAQLITYPNVTWVDETVVAVDPSGDDFVVHTNEDRTLRAKRIVLATGVRDELPEIPGLKDRWGQSVFHCPYCHGYELNRGPLGVLATSEASMHQALLIPEWGPTTFFTNGIFEPDNDQIQQLEARNVSIFRERITEISGTRATVHLDDGRAIELAGLFIASRTEVSSPLVESIRCELIETPLGRIIKTDEIKETTVAGVFACGDAARAAGNVTFAIADGATAGIATHRSLILSAVG